MGEVERLTAEVRELRARLALNDATDAALERAQRARWPLSRVLEALTPLLTAATGADHVWVQISDEWMDLQEFHLPREAAPPPLDFAEVRAWLGTDPRVDRVVGDVRVVAQRLDVDGDVLGVVAISLIPRQTGDAPASSSVPVLLDTWCEQFDNYLAALAQLRRKHLVTMQLSQALRAPLVTKGVREAVEVLMRHVDFAAMLVVFRYEDDRRGTSLHYIVARDGAVVCDSHTPDMEIDEFVRAHADGLLEGGGEGLRDRFGVNRGREDVLIAGVRDRRVIGKLIVTGRHGEFAVFDRELIEVFADDLRHRVVDYNREWKSLSRCFGPAHVRRLLSREDYADLLSPRETMAALMFCDISGFTRICEQAMASPSRIAALIDYWGDRVVDLVWEHGGVFDKMVGDCVIAMWGPPFDDLAPGRACGAALAAAQAIRAFTRELRHDPVLPELADLDPPIGVAIGLHWARASIGRFGPDDVFTAFSSGMNAAARLQGLASRDQVLAMDAFVEALGAEDRFGPWQHSPVKNVAQPLRYAALR